MVRRLVLAAKCVTCFGETYMLTSSVINCRICVFSVSLSSSWKLSNSRTCETRRRYRLSTCNDLFRATVLSYLSLYLRLNVGKMLVRCSGISKGMPPPRANERANARNPV